MFSNVKLAGLDCDLEQDKQSPCNVNYKKHGNSDTVRNVWEDIGFGVEREYYEGLEV